MLAAIITGLVPSPLLIISFFSLLLVVIFSYLKYSCPHQLLAKCGIKGPPPSFFVGNYPQLVKEGFFKFSHSLHEKYGPIVGFYWGIRPYVTVTDIDLIKKITVKDFEYFINRPKGPELLGRSSDETLGLIQDRDQKWRVGRQMLSPAFSSSKLRAITPLIENSVKTLVEIFRENADTDKSMEFTKPISTFTMEVLIATSLGRFIKVQRNESDQLIKACSTLFHCFREDDDHSFLTIMFFNNFPWLESVMKPFIDRLPHVKSFKLVQSIISQIIKERRVEKDQSMYKDLLQQMIDATIEDEKTKEKKTLTDEEINAHAIILMLSAYETTSIAVSFTSYQLAVNPDVQRKLQEDIDDYFEKNPDASQYQAIQDISLLEMVIYESLRHMPDESLDRECQEDYRYKDIVIPKGTSVYLSIPVLHKDPELWKDPEKFNPYRFTPEEKAKRPQQCFMPFGIGPRNCIGMKLAMLEARITLMELLKEFTFVRAPDTEVPLQMVLGTSTMPKNGIYLKVASRKKTAQ